MKNLSRRMLVLQQREIIFRNLVSDHLHVIGGDWLIQVCIIMQV